VSRRFRIPLWVEIASAILAALVISNLATILFFQVEGERRWQRFGNEFLGERIGETASAILASPQSKQSELLKALSKRNEHFTIDAAPLVDDKALRDAATESRVAAHLTGVAKGDVRVRSLAPGNMFFMTGTGAGGALYTGGGSLPPLPPGQPPPVFERQVFLRTGGPGLAALGGPPGPPPERMVVSIPMGDGRWLNARVSMPGPPVLPWLSLFSGGVAAVTLLLASIWIGRRVATPLQRLSEAARSMRRGEPAPPVPETGPAAVRDATRSFNAMSQRLLSTLEGQRAMMAAIAHDLRTPIATLRLRAEFVGDEEAKARLLETLAEMQAMTEAVLDTVRTGATGEIARAMDVAALSESLATDMAEIGGSVTFIAGAPVRCICRANGIRRALRNLIENALRYGKRARVSVAAHGEVAQILVEDDGPGVPDGDMERVFAPFARLEQSRSRETGGYGLGLSIARLIARGHGGDVTLANIAGGGLRATLSLPLAT
jgi:signal transduction histidine kinase